MIETAREADLSDVLSLLSASSLPSAGVEEHLEDFLVARDERSELLGCIGLEVYDDVGLLRSLAVTSGSRGAGLGGALVERLLTEARERGIRTMYLLTTTAERYFPRFGFERLTRAEADPCLLASEELRGACPDTAVLMRLRL
jgi:amino-acid N-acetyltransferase